MQSKVSKIDFVIGQLIMIWKGFAWCSVKTSSRNWRFKIGPRQCCHSRRLIDIQWGTRLRNFIWSLWLDIFFIFCSRILFSSKQLCRVLWYKNSSEEEKHGRKKIMDGRKKKNRGTRDTKCEGELSALYFLFIDNRD